MNQHFLPGNPPLEINLRPSKRAKRLSLRVSRLDGRVTLTFPQQMAESRALDFALEKEQWLRAQLENLEERVAVRVGGAIPIRGISTPIVLGNTRRIEIGEQIVIPQSAKSPSARLASHLKQAARTELAFASDKYAAKIGMPYTRLSIRDTRTRWGSCSSNGGLMYSWRLIMAPPEVLDYVAAHEVAHLSEMNHSQNFWRIVEDLYGDYRAERQWLRNRGHDLHRYRFED